MTQGVLSILERDGEPCNDRVLYKIIAGCDGHSENLQRLASELLDYFKQQGSSPDLDTIYHMAGVHVGCKDCLVVMNSETALHKGEGDLHERYRKTFDLPCFNPRWKEGTANVETIILTPKKEEE